MRLRAWIVVTGALLGVALMRSAAAAPAPALAGDVLFRQAAPAIAYVETPIASGSGILFEGGYLLTDAHVVWPYDTVRVRFPGGREFRDVPVVAEDPLADLAVIRVGEVPGVVPLRFGNPARLDIGSDVYLIGYPAERQPNPTPTISRGLLSRIREGGPVRLQFAQTDAVASGGASGGAMLSPAGEVVGIIQLRFPSTTFALALSGSQALERMQALLRGERGDLGPRQFSSIAGRPVAGGTARLGGSHEERAYLVRTLSDVAVSVRARGTDADLSVFGPSGTRVAHARERDGEAVVRFAARAQQPYVLILAGGEAGGTFDLQADHPIIPIADPDDARLLRAGGFVLGNFDYYNDVDFFTLDLTKGQTVTLTAESTLADPVIIVSRADDPGGPVLDSSDTTAERGLLGNDAVLSFTASADRRYLVVVADFNIFGSGRGAYRLSVYPSRPSRDAEGAATITSGEPPGSTPAPFVFGGGDEDDLVLASGCSRGGLRIWAASPDGRFVPFIPGALIMEVNAEWAATFPFGIPAGTVLIGQCQREG